MKRNEQSWAFLRGEVISGNKLKGAGKPNDPHMGSVGK